MVSQQLRYFPHCFLDCEVGESSSGSGLSLGPNSSRFPDSVQFSRSVMSYSLQPHGLQHARVPCPSPTPELAQTQAIESVIAMFMLKYFSGKDEERGQDIGI